jgi:GNAT superfamily N-acetyltransferase
MNTGKRKIKASERIFAFKFCLGSTTCYCNVPGSDLGQVRDVEMTTDKPVVLRPHRVGDIGWVVHRHGLIYAEQYGWDLTFEALVARVAADFIDQFDSARDCCWIAEQDGATLGAAFVVKTDDPKVAKLRLVYVEPSAQGQGVGRLLVERCMSFARDAGYGRMVLWTNDVLLPARTLYQKLGFAMTDAKPYRGFGHNLVGETWERDL